MKASLARRTPFPVPFSMPCRGVHMQVPYRKVRTGSARLVTGVTRTVAMAPWGSVAARVMAAMGAPQYARAANVSRRETRAEVLCSWGPASPVQLTCDALALAGAHCMRRPRRRRGLLHRVYVGGAHSSEVVQVARGRRRAHRSDVAPERCFLGSKTESNALMHLGRTNIFGKPDSLAVQCMRLSNATIPPPKNSIPSSTSVPDPKGGCKDHPIGLTEDSVHKKSRLVGILKTQEGEKAGPHQSDITVVQLKRNQESRKMVCAEGQRR
ncbi:hypothetical protein K438DRAFT_1787713 [Mycena galopus ATCC 62051]|nr:hypothetical protein K438DRAFT_1787713 [Mycena galopus ATCC 62051]